MRKSPHTSELDVPLVFRETLECFTETVQNHYEVHFRV